MLSLPFDSWKISAGSGLLDGQNIVTLFEQKTLNILDKQNFDDLPIKYRAVASDILTGEEVVISNGSIADAMRASMSIPAVFKPYYLHGHYCADGGIVNNMPADVASEFKPDIIIAVRLDAALITNAQDFRTPFDAFGQTQTLFVDENVNRITNKIDLVIVPNLSNLSPLDFDKVDDLVKRGENAAYDNYSNLKKIADQISNSRNLVSPEEQKNRRAKFYPIPVLKSVRVIDGDRYDERFIKKEFENGTNKQLDQKWLKEKIDKIYATRKYEIVGFSLESAGEGEAPGTDIGIVRVVPKKTADQYLLGGLQYRGSAFSSSFSELDMLLGLTIEDLTGKNSYLYGEASLINTQKYYLEYFQPVGGLLFIMPYFRYSVDYNDYVYSDPSRTNYLYRSTGGGGWLGMLLGRNSELKGGYSFEFINPIQSYGSLTNNETAGSLHIIMVSDLRQTTVFPDSGFYYLLDYSEAKPWLGGTIDYNKLEFDCQLVIPFSRVFSAGVTFSSGTDFSGWYQGFQPVISYYAFSLHTPFQFAGYEASDITGSHKIAGGIDAYYKLFPISSLFGGDVYLLANFSIGNCIKSYQNYLSFFPFRWNATTGVGLKLTRWFGIAGRVTYADWQNWVATIDVGSFYEPLEERR